jgi:hypothetical protein
MKQQEHDEWAFADGTIAKVYHDTARTGNQKITFLVDLTLDAPGWSPEQVRVELWLTPKAWPHVEPKLRGLGFTGKLEDAASIADDWKKYVGQDVRLALREKEGGKVDARLCRARSEERGNR